MATAQRITFAKAVREVRKIVKQDRRLLVPLSAVEDAMGIRGVAMIKLARAASANGRMGIWEAPDEIGGEADDVIYCYAPEKLRGDVGLTSDGYSAGQVEGATGLPDAGLFRLEYAKAPAAPRRKYKDVEKYDPYRAVSNSLRYASYDTGLVFLGLGRPHWSPDLEYAPEPDGDGLDFDRTIPQASCKVCGSSRLVGFQVCLGCTSAGPDAEEFAAWQTAKAEREAPAIGRDQ